MGGTHPPIFSIISMQDPDGQVLTSTTPQKIENDQVASSKKKKMFPALGYPNWTTTIKSVQNSTNTFI
ncbi:hypothetical protein EUGRSUZ_E00395 [Eucalyptus grandis]|uniref:Uncharacterized protein n=2 Tax=Eucalyptus grandis TaxID=71139 RepID=A0ACC3KRA6_EUCGR|nr:hypothetical protein EUGRSUZ_E00395 [Eucalyptus grandis]